jgi:hypothetical protein
MKNLKKIEFLHKDILKQKESNFFLRFLSFFYILFSEYQLIYSSLNKKKDVVIVHFHERLQRKDIDYFLVRTQENAEKNVSLLIFKRKFRFPSNFVLNHYDKIYNDCLREFNKNIKPFRKVIIFFPHCASGALVQLFCMFSSKKTAALQHGYYQYNDKQAKLYSKATRSDFAYIYDNSYSNFFKACKKLIICGNYFIKPQALFAYEPHKQFIFLSVLHKHNLNKTINIIKELNLNYFLVRHHPHTSFYIKIKFWLAFRKYPWKISSSNSVGDINYFLDTTLWREIKFPPNVKIFLINSLSKKKKLYTRDSLEIFAENSFNIFIKRLRLFYDS